jgi:hypothetical protein
MNKALIVFLFLVLIARGCTKDFQLTERSVTLSEISELNLTDPATGDMNRIDSIAL